MKINAGDISCIILAGDKGKRVGGLDEGLARIFHRNADNGEHVL